MIQSDRQKKRCKNNHVTLTRKLQRKSLNHLLLEIVLKIQQLKQVKCLSTHYFGEKEPNLEKILLGARLAYILDA